MVQYQLDYFGFRSRGDYIRYIFHQAGVPFQDNVIQFEDWPNVKPTTPLGQVPVLHIDGKQLADSVAICVFLGKQFGLSGENDLEAAKCHSLAAAVEIATGDFINPIITEYFGGNIAKAAENCKLKLETTISAHLKLFEKLLAENGGTWFVGSKITWADLMIAHFHDGIAVWFEPRLLDEYPKLKQHRDRVYEQPNIKKYAEARHDVLYIPGSDAIQKELA